jgi:uncharacterized membrane protein YciS (DUF1049 family)
MSFASEASKLLTNKYFLYFMVFLAATNVLGYLVTNKLNAVIFFALVSLLTYQFSKNMAIVLLVGIIATNFLMANRRMREGLENGTTTTPTSTSTSTTTPTSTSTTTPTISPAVERVAETQPEMKDVINAVTTSTSNDQVKQKLQTGVTPVESGLPTSRETGVKSLISALAEFNDVSTGWSQPDHQHHMSSDASLGIATTFRRLKPNLRRKLGR